LSRFGRHLDGFGHSLVSTLHDDLDRAIDIVTGSMRLAPLAAKSDYISKDFAIKAVCAQAKMRLNGG
jgi:hypothetical protein